jgi:hypothetical protein
MRMMNLHRKSAIIASLQWSGRQKGNCAILGGGRLAGANARGKAAVLQHANSRRFAGQIEMLGNGFRDGRDRVGCELPWSIRLSTRQARDLASHVTWSVHSVNERPWCHHQDLFWQLCNILRVLDELQRRVYRDEMFG